MGWRAQYLLITVLGALTTYLVLFLSIPQEVEALLRAQERGYREAAGALLTAYVQARAAAGVAPETALQEIGRALAPYTLHALPPAELPNFPQVVALGISLADGRQLAVGPGPAPCPDCDAPGFYFRLFGMSLLVWIAVLAVHVFLWARFSFWLRRIQAAARAIAAGDPAPLLPRSSSDELGQIAEALQEIARSLQRFRETRRRFLLIASHELLTPLSLLLSELEAAEGAPELAEVHSRIRRAGLHGRHLARLIEDMLGMAREDRAAFPIRPEPLDLAEILLEIAEGMRFRIETSGHRLKVVLEQIPLPVRADPVRLRQVLENLLENARRYSQPGEEIRVTAGAGEQAMV
ncbi:MAG: HAMP domain-containing histidine kinase, partial [Thermoflexus sp.]|nr:HAMP domain-containing histidine kinase [Thermoflexus sp.]